MSLFGNKTAAESLDVRLTAVETLCSDLARKNRSLELEYTELYDKVRHQMSRMARRDARAQQNGEDVPEENSEPGPYDHMDPISKSIMLRRGMVRNEK